MKKAVFFCILVISISGTQCAYKIAGNFDQIARSIDTIAVLPTAFKLTDNTHVLKKHRNDTLICSNLHRELVSELNLALNGKYVLLTDSGFRMISDTLRKSISTDFRYINYRLRLKDRFVFSNSYLQKNNAPGYPYVLINYMEGKYSIFKNKNANRSAAGATSILAFLFTWKPTTMELERSQIHMQSVLYDTRHQKVLYHSTNDYRASVKNPFAFKDFVKKSVRKLGKE